MTTFDTEALRRCASKLERAFLAGVEHALGADGCGAREGEAARHYAQLTARSSPSEAAPSSDDATSQTAPSSSQIGTSDDVLAPIVVERLRELATEIDDNEWTHNWRSDRDFLRDLANSLERASPPLSEALPNGE